MAEPSGCPKCAGTMEPGFTLDQGHGTYAPAEWVEGEPEKSMWTPRGACNPPAKA